MWASPVLIDQACAAVGGAFSLLPGLADAVQKPRLRLLLWINSTHGRACCAIRLCLSNSLRHQKHSDSTRDALVNHHPEMATPFQGPQDPHLRVPLCWLHPAEHGQDLKAAVLPVPDCDWAIRFCGLDPGGIEMRITLVRNNQVSKCSFWGGRKGLFPSLGFLPWAQWWIFYMVFKKTCLNIKKWLFQMGSTLKNIHSRL